MSMRLTRDKTVRNYVFAIVLFIVVVTLSLAIFFVSLFANVERAVETELWETMVRQSNHIDFSFSIRFQHLESAADFLGKQGDVHGEIAQQYIQSLGKNSSFQHVFIYDAEGNGFVENGETFEGADLSYIQQALRGERNVSEPSRSVVDNVTRFFLSVPIPRGEEIIGVLSASFDMEQMGGLLFADSYEGNSVVFIAGASGRIAYSDTPSNPFGLYSPMNFYEQLAQANFQNGESDEKLIASFGRRETGMTRFKQPGRESLFLLYTPIADSSLMLLHAIPRDVAYGEFGVIEVSIIIVAAVILICVVLLVMFLVTSSTTSQRNLVRAAQTDPLTGLFNKQHTQEAIDLWLKNEARTGIQAMMFMDIDYFKQINDQYGHNVGDDALRFVGQALRQEFRSSDIIGRVGGDEFVVFMRNVPVKHVVRVHATSLGMRLKSAEIPGLDKGMLHCSIGIAYAPEHGNSYHMLTIHADKALYKTKERGRDGFTEYVESTEEQGAIKPQP